MTGPQLNYTIGAYCQKRINLDSTLWHQWQLDQRGYTLHHNFESEKRFQEINNQESLH